MSAGNRPSLNKPATSRQARSNTNDSELFAMRRRAWLEKGVLVVDVSTVFSAADRDVLKRVGNRIYGVRSTLIKG